MISAVLAAALLPALLPAGASAAPAAAPIPTLSSSIGACWVDVSAAPPSTEVTLTLRSAAGTLKGKQTVSTDVAGEGDVCFAKDVVGGDTVVLKKGSTTLRTLTVPRLSIRPDRDTDRITGTGPANGSVHVGYADCGVPGYSCSLVGSDTRTVDGKGRWSWNLAGTMDITGTDRFDLVWTNTKGDEVSIYIFAPRIEATVGSSTVVGDAWPGTAVTVKLVRGGSVIAKGTVKADAASEYSARLRRPNGVLVKVAQGDTIKADVASDAAVKATITEAIVGDGIEGTCFPTTRIRLTLKDGGSEQYEYTLTDGAGAYSFPDLGLDARVGQVALVMCTDSSGDTIIRKLTIPAP